MILRELPVKDTARLVVFHSGGFNPGMNRAAERMLSFSWPKYVDFRNHCAAFQGVAARFRMSAMQRRLIGFSLDHMALLEEQITLRLWTGRSFSISRHRSCSAHTKSCKPFPE
jgi:hypothetical protein